MFSVRTSARLSTLAGVATALALALALLPSPVSASNSSVSHAVPAGVFSECNPGFYDVAGTCVEATPGHWAPGGGDQQFDCAPGTYQSLPGQDACIGTLPGFYASGSGNIGPTPCDEGTYQTDPGMTSCNPADPGNYAQGTANFEETQCLPGSYEPGYGAGSCITASPDFYVPGSGATDQIPCLSGQVSSAGATSCHAMSPAHLLLLLKYYVTGIGQGTYLRFHVSAARTAVLANDIAGARHQLHLVKRSAAAQSGVTLTPTQAATIIQDVKAVLQLLLP